MARVFEPLDAVMLRAPRLPVAAGMPPAGQQAGDHALELLAREPEVRRALAAGSLALLDALDREEPPQARTRRRLARYVRRMSMRATPFGAFAGVAGVPLGSRTTLRLGAPRTRTELDLEWLHDLVDRLERRPEVLRELTLLVAPVLHKAGRAWLLSRVAEHGERAEASVRATTPVLAALDAAATPQPFPAVAEAVSASVGGAPAEVVEGMLAELVRQGFLVGDLRPPLTVPDPVRHLRARLVAIAAVHDERAALDDLLDLCDRADGEDDAVATDAVRAIAVRCERPEADEPARPPQVDLAWATSGTLHRAVADEAARAAEVLVRLTPLPDGASANAAFRRAFAGRYGEGREVPLLEAVHAELGIGSVLEGRPGPPSMEARHRVLSRLAAEALAEEAEEVELTDELVRSLAVAERFEHPLSLDLIATVVASSAEAIDRGDFRLVVGANTGARSAGRHLGRFTGILGDDADALLAAVAELERAVSADDAIDAELSFLPARRRLANVTVRPLAASHEIAIGVPPRDPARAIPASELVLVLEGDRLRLRWPRADRDVRVTASHMLNPQLAPPVCRLLTELAQDGVAQLAPFDWGPGRTLPYLPRVRYGRTILRGREWRLALPPAVAELDGSELVAWLRAWRARWDAPAWLAFGVSDHVLPLHLEDLDDVEELREAARSGPLTLFEHPAGSAPWLAGAGGRHVCEVVVPLVRRKASAPAPQGSRRQPRRDDAHRLAPPGSEWLFMKLYGPASLEPDLLGGAVLQQAEALVARGDAEEWHFLRYADPDPHVRLRFRGAPDVLLARVLGELAAWATEQARAGHVTRFAFDTYEREVERYGGPEMLRACERVFAADSHAMTELLGLSVQRRVEVADLALLAVDDLLQALGADLDRRVQWYRDLGLRRVGGDEFRRRKDELAGLLARRAPEGDAAAEVTAALERRRAAIEQVAASIDEAVWPSLVHMTCNRLLGTDRDAERRTLALLARTSALLRHRAPARAPAPLS